jgi:hypothetical protein
MLSPTAAGGVEDFRVGVAVLGPGRLARTRVDGPLLAIGGGLDPPGRDSAGDQDLSCGFGAMAVQREIVLPRAALIGRRYRSRPVRAVGLV